MVAGFLDRLAGHPLALLAEAFEHSSVAKAVIGLAPGSLGELVEVNPAFCALVGRPREELVGTAYPALLPAGEWAAAESALAATAAGAAPEPRAERSFPRPDGSVARALVGAVVARDGDGGAHLVAELVETTDRHMLADRLRRQGEQTRAAFDASPLGMAICDERGRFLRVNTSLEVMVGRGRDELLGHDADDFTHPEDRAGNARLRRQVLREPGTVAAFDQRFVRPDGAVRWIRIGLTTIAGPPGTWHHLLQCEDVTADKEAAAAARRETERLRVTIAVQREITAAAAEGPDTVLRLISDRALRVLPAGDTARVCLLDEAGTTLLPAARTGPGHLDGPPLPVTGSPAGAALTGGITIRCDDTEGDERVGAAFARAAGVRSVLVAPLRAATGPIGVLMIGSARPGAFDEADEQQLTLLADALAGALQHAADAARAQDLLHRATGAVRALEQERTAALAALDRLAQSEHRFAEVFDHSPLAKLVAGLRGAGRGRVTLANPALSRLLDLPAGEIVGRAVAELVHTPLDLDGGAAGGRHVQKAELRRRDGALVPVDAHFSVIADEQGPASVVVQLRDVTAERAAEAALTRSEEQFRTAFEGSPIGLLIADEHGRFQRVNPAAVALTGRPAESLIGLTHRDITDPADLDASVRARLELLRGADEARYDKRLRHPDGGVSWTRVTLTLIPGPAGRLWRLMQLQDITAERAAAVAAEREMDRLRATLAVQRDVTAAAGDRDCALRVVADRAVELFEAADGSAVELLDGDEMVYRAAAGTLASAEGTRIAVTGSLSGLVVTTGTGAHCADTATDQRVDRAACRRLGIGSMLVAPLHAENRVIGCLKIAAARPHVFDDLDEQQLALLAESLASALRHADDAARTAAAMAALEAGEARFRLAFENSPLGVTLIAVEDGDLGHHLHANPAMTTITGYRADELRTLTHRDLVLPDDRPDAGRLAAAVADGSPAVRADLRYRHKDGHPVSVSLRVGAVRDPDGTVPYLVGQVEDVTAQRAAEAALRRQARLLELIPAAVIVRDLDGAVRWWNAGAERLYGWSLDAARGRAAHRLLGTVFPDHAGAADVAARLTADGSWEGPLRQLTADGREITVLSHQVLHEPGAQVLEINTDVTAARAAERALAESERRFRAQFTHSAAGQVIRSVDGTLIEVNPAFAAMLGRTVAELATVSDGDLLHPDDAVVQNQRLAAVFAGEADAFGIEGRLRHADGHWVDVASTVSLVRDEHGRPKTLIAVMTDISARRAAESARDQAAADLADRNTALEAANQLKLDIIGMLGHEIGNPLSAIRGYAEVLVDDWADLDDARRDRAIRSIGRQAGRLEDIVHEVLGMVTVEAGTIVPVRDPLPLDTEIRRALTAVDQERIPVLGESATVLCNPGHLQQMLVNLLSNAAKYGGGATAVRIVRDGDRVRVRVEDNGPGVPEEFRHRLFERLARAERDARTVRGTGLGLYIVRGLARANDGDVHHEPNPAGGSVFVLELPVSS